jgi:hypothetical protein
MLFSRSWPKTALAKVKLSGASWTRWINKTTCLTGNGKSMFMSVQRFWPRIRRFKQRSVRSLTWKWPLVKSRHWRERRGKLKCVHYQLKTCQRCPLASHSCQRTSLYHTKASRILWTTQSYRCLRPINASHGRSFRRISATKPKQNQSSTAKKWSERIT